MNNELNEKLKKTFLFLLTGSLTFWLFKDRINFLLHGNLLNHRNLIAQGGLMVGGVIVTSLVIYYISRFFMLFFVWAKSLELWIQRENFIEKSKLLFGDFVKTKPFFAYILMVSVIYGIIYLPLPLTGNMYIYLDIGADTYASYWPMYAFISDYFHSFHLSGWAFQHGLGTNIFSAASPWLFDPYNIFIIPFDKMHIDIGLFLALTAKVFSLATLSFLYIKRLGYRGMPLMASAIVYTFCGFFVGWGQHYQYATVFVFFTLLLYFFERWLLSSNDWVGVVISTALFAAFWPYALYMVLLFLAVYYIFRKIILNGFHWKDFFVTGFLTVGLLLLGIGLAGVLFLPQVYAIGQSPRMTGGILPSLSFADSNEYYTILMRFLSNGLLGVSNNMYKGFQNYYESPFLYTSILTIFLIPQLFFISFRRKRYIWISALVIFLLLFPHVTNPIFSALSKYSYRWTFLLVPVFSVALAEGLRYIDRPRKWLYVVTMLLGLYAGFISVQVSQLPQIPKMAVNLPWSAWVVIVACALYGLLLYNQNTKIASYSIMIVLLAETALNGFATVNLRGVVPVSDKSKIPYFDTSTMQALNAISESDKSFYRVNKAYDYVYHTDALFQNFYGEKQYSSIIPYYIWEWQDLFGIRGSHSNYLLGFSDRQFMRNISAGKYLLTKKEHSYFGYEEIGHYGDVYVYKNNNATAIGVTYKNYIPVKEFKKLGWGERQYILYDAVVVPDDFGLGHPDLAKISAPLLKDGPAVDLIADFSYLSPNISVKENDFPKYLDFNTSGDTSSKFCVNFLEASDTSVSISFSMETPTQGQGEIFYKTSENDDYDIEDVVSFDVKPGFQEYYFTLPIEGVNSICVNLAGIVGNLQVKDFSVFHRNDKEITAHATSLIKSSDIKNIIVDADYVSGMVDMDSSGLVYFSVPFDAGWKAYVDGVPVQKIRTNIAFTGVYVGDGRHTVELKYTVPWLRGGILISFLSFILLFGIYIFVKYRVDRNSVA